MAEMPHSKTYLSQGLSRTTALNVFTYFIRPSLFIFIRFSFSSIECRILSRDIQRVPPFLKGIVSISAAAFDYFWPFHNEIHSIWTFYSAVLIVDNLIIIRILKFFIYIGPIKDVIPPNAIKYSKLYWLVAR